MAVSVTCPRCGQVGTVPDIAAGKAGRCSACQTVFRIESAPSSGSQRPASAAACPHDTQSVIPEALKSLLATAARGPDLDARLRTIDQLGELKNPLAVKPLVDLLQDPNPLVRAEVAWALGTIGDATATETLVAALKDIDGDVRLKAAKSLWLIRDKRAIQPLMTALRDPDEGVRFFAEKALREMGWSGLLQQEPAQTIPPPDAAHTAVQTDTSPKSNTWLGEPHVAGGALMNRINCPGCGKRLKYGHECAGKKVKCQKCGTSFRLPGFLDSELQGPAGHPVSCPHCKGRILHDTKLAGRVVTCPHCRAHLQMPNLGSPVSPHVAEEPKPLAQGGNTPAASRALSDSLGKVSGCKSSFGTTPTETGRATDLTRARQLVATELQGLRAVTSALSGLKASHNAAAIEAVCSGIGEVIKAIESGSGIQEGMFAFSKVGEQLFGIASKMQDGDWAWSVGRDQSRTWALLQQSCKLEQISRDLSAKAVREESEAGADSRGGASVMVNSWAATFKMQKGQFNEQSNDKPETMQAVERLLDALVITPRPGASNISEVDESKIMEVLSWAQQLDFSRARAEVSRVCATEHLARALSHEDSYWFPRYATDRFVTSDGKVVRWQSVRLFTVDYGDRTCFGGLWQWELSRVSSDTYHMTVTQVQSGEAQAVRPVAVETPRAYGSR